MLQSRWSRWMFVLVTMYVVGAAIAISLLLAKQTIIGQLIGALTDGLTAVWLFKGAYQMWSVRKTRWVAGIGSSLIVAGVVARLLLTGYTSWALVIVGVWVMGAAFLGTVQLIRAAPQLIIAAPLLLAVVSVFELGVDPGTVTETMMKQMSVTGATWEAILSFAVAILVILILMVPVLGFSYVLRINYKAGAQAALILIAFSLGIHFLGHALGEDAPLFLRTLASVSAGLTGIALSGMCLVLPESIRGLARITIDEAVRMKLPVVLIGGVMILLPALALFRDPKEKLQYHMQSYLNWSLIVIGIVFSLVTILLACWTVTNDVKQKQIFMTASKPISRFQYLVGRWLGIGLLNLTLVLIAGAGVYVFHEVVKTGPALNERPGKPSKYNVDRLNMHNEVLTARRTIRPAPRNMDVLKAIFDKRLKALRIENPDKWGKMEDPVENLPAQGFVDIQTHVKKTWHTVSPGNARTYVFKNLQRAKRFDKYVVLRYKPQVAKTPEDQLLRLRFIIHNGRDLRSLKVPANQVSLLKIPVWAIDPDTHELAIRIENHTIQPKVSVQEGQFIVHRMGFTVSFDPGKGLELLYRVDNFAPNFIRSIMLIWIQLLFVSMFGLMAGTFLGFPVAALLSLVVFVTYMSSFIHTSLQSYEVLDIHDLSYWAIARDSLSTLWNRITELEFFAAFRAVLRIIGHLFMLVTPSFSEFQPAPLLSEGRVVPWPMVGRAYLQLGVAWTGVVAVLAWLIFRKRELARITV